MPNVSNAQQELRDEHYAKFCRVLTMFEVRLKLHSNLRQPTGRNLRLSFCRLNRSCRPLALTHSLFLSVPRQGPWMRANTRCSTPQQSSGAPCSLPRSRASMASFYISLIGPNMQIFRPSSSIVVSTRRAPRPGATFSPISMASTTGSGASRASDMSARSRWRRNRLNPCPFFGGGSHRRS